MLARVFVGLLVSLKSLDNKDHFFCVETKPSLPEAGSCPLNPSPTPLPALHSPALLSSPLLCLLQNVFFLYCSFFSSEIVLPFFSNHLLCIFVCLFSIHTSVSCIETPSLLSPPALPPFLYFPNTLCPPRHSGLESSALPHYRHTSPTNQPPLNVLGESR